MWMRRRDRRLGELRRRARWVREARMVPTMRELAEAEIERRRGRRAVRRVAGSAGR